MRPTLVRSIRLLGLVREWCGCMAPSHVGAGIQTFNSGLWDENVLKSQNQDQFKTSVDTEPVSARSGGKRGRLTCTVTEGTWTVVGAVCGDPV